MISRDELAELIYTNVEARTYLHEGAEDAADAILNRLAEAWDEGHQASETSWKHVYEGHPVPAGEMCDTCMAGNPYQTEGGGT